jgi:hypothetical protein
MLPDLHVVKPIYIYIYVIYMLAYKHAYIHTYIHTYIYIYIYIYILYVVPGSKASRWHPRSAREAVASLPPVCVLSAGSFELRQSRLSPSFWAEARECPMQRNSKRRLIEICGFGVRVSIRG